MKMGLDGIGGGEEIIHARNVNSWTPRNQSKFHTDDVYGTASVGNGDPAAFAGSQYIQLAASAHTPTSGDLTNMYSYPKPGMVVEFNAETSGVSMASAQA